MQSILSEEFLKFVSLSVVFSILITIPLWMARPEKPKKNDGPETKPEGP